MVVNFLVNLLKPDDLILQDGKIHVSHALNNNYHIYINGNLVKTIHNSSNEEPTEEEVYAALEEEGIEPDNL